jgi:hypothetical protein
MAGPIRRSNRARKPKIYWEPPIATPYKRLLQPCITTPLGMPLPTGTPPPMPPGTPLPMPPGMPLPMPPPTPTPLPTPATRPAYYIYSIS